MPEAAVWRGVAWSILLLLALLVPAGTNAQVAQWQPDQAGSQLEIALVTIGPGQIYWERFGHNAILVRDRSSGAETLYNYGIFDFEEADFFLKFIRGQMRYRMIGVPAELDLAQYLDEGRWIDFQPLNLSPPQRVALRDFLVWNERPENSHYRYDYFVSNCSTKVRDALDQALGGALGKALKGRARGFTFRDHALRLTAPDWWLAVAIHAGLGPYADRPIDFWEETFVPMELARRIADVRIVDDSGATLPLVAQRRRVAEARFADPSDEPPYWRWRFLGVGVGLAVLLHALSRQRAHLVARIGFAALASILWLLAGFGGATLAGLWLATEHQSAWANENLLLFNPLCLLLIPVALLSASRQWRASGFTRVLSVLIAIAALLALGVKILPWFGQANGDWIALWLPVHLSLALVLARRTQSTGH